MIVNNLKKGEHIILLEDVTTTGGSALKAAKILQDIGCKVVGCITILDRQEGGIKAFAESNIPLIPLVLRSDISGEK